jgi:hypothetical protein
MVRNLICQMRSFNHFLDSKNSAIVRNYIWQVSKTLNQESTTYSQSSTQLYLAATVKSRIRLCAVLSRQGLGGRINEEPD